MYRGILSLLLIVALGHLCAQERPSLSDARCDQFTTDVQSNLYLWKGNTLDMYSMEGMHLADYKDLKAGNITSVSAQLGSKILVYHQESGTINLLNNKLAPIDNALDLFEKGWFTISNAALLNTNRIVLYDEANQELIITDLRLNVENKTHCDFGSHFIPQLLKVSSEKEILLIDSASGVYFFDAFGSFDKRIAIVGIKDACLFQNTLYYLTQNKIYAYHLQTMEQFGPETYPFTVISFVTNHSNLFYLDETGKIHIDARTIY